ncbi:MAG: alpha-mannosidase [Actinobacteria bacterium]|nr:alpha-mannosidase [Actinomycetota bacterium]
MHDDRIVVERRLRRTLDQRIAPAIVADRRPLAVERWEVPGEPVSAADAAAADYEPFAVGRRFGKPWGTTWFRFAARVPEAWAGRTVRAVVDLGFTNHPGFQSEGLFWRVGDDGAWEPVRGLNPLNDALDLADPALGGEEVRLTLEAASNPNLSGAFPSPMSYLETAGSGPLYALQRAELVVIDEEVEALRFDMIVATQLMEQLPLDSVRRHELLRALEASLDALWLSDIAGTAAAARSALADVLGRRAAESAHRVSAIGHAHIDTAWLWPLRETRRKCARTFTNQLDLLDRYPEHRFACSQAAQYDWMREGYPSAFERIRERVADGRWIPVGGMWVEADTNLAGGEALIRQFTHGQRFFDEHFGVECTEVWIPDVFGYNANLPQIMRHVGISRFLTQKLSWNTTNRFPHHSFWWEGIDGSTVFTHFPPVETYNANLSGYELAHTVHTFADKGRSNRSLMPFGHGDGGGGPTAEMLERYRRSRDLDGSPRIEIEAPAEFFDKAIAEYTDAPRWVGELYLEMHRGTFTSQLKTKQGNRRCETKLREAEMWCVAAYGGRVEDGYPADALDRLWKEVLLLQFHDILPGSSIGWVHREAEATYGAVLNELESIIGGALAAICGDQPSVSNPTPFHVALAVPIVRRDGSVVDTVMSLAPHSLTPLDVAADRADPTVVSIAPAVLERVGGGWRLSNGLIEATVSSDGTVSSLRHLATGREVIAPGHVGNLLSTFEDVPTMFDAWEIESYSTRRPCELRSVESIEVGECTTAAVRLCVTRRFGASSIEQTYVLRAGSPRLDIETDADWHERETMLKVGFGVDVRTTEVTREIQFGEYTTPIHTNTSWDAARFEVCAQRWIDCAEPGFGVALLTDSHHGFDVSRVAEGGADRPVTSMRITLLRSALYPDPEQDQGRHRFTYSVMPHGGDRHEVGLIAQASLLTNTVRVVKPSVGAAERARPLLVTSENPRVVVETVKAADDGGGDIVVRCYESEGRRTNATLVITGAFEAVERSDGRERVRSETAPLPVIRDAGSTRVALGINAFEIVTLRCRLARDGAPASSAASEVADVKPSARSAQQRSVGVEVGQF